MADIFLRMQRHAPSAGTALLLLVIFCAVPVKAQIQGETWRGPDGVPPLVMVVLLAAAVVAACVVVLYTLTLGRQRRSGGAVQDS